MQGTCFLSGDRYIKEMDSKETVEAPDLPVYIHKRSLPYSYVRLELFRILSMRR